MIQFNSWWRLNEAAGTARADSIGTNTLADHNTVAQVAGHTDPWAAGFTSASSQYLSIASNPSLVMGSGVELTLAVWLYLTDVSIHRFIVHKGDGERGSNEYLIEYEPANSAFIFYRTGVSGSQYNAISSFGVASLNTWYFVVARFSEADGGEISVNGGAWDSDGSAGANDSIKAAAGDFRIGADDGVAAGFMDGRIGPVGFARTRISDADTITLYNGGAGLDPYYPRCHPWFVQ